MKKTLLVMLVIAAAFICGGGIHIHLNHVRTRNAAVKTGKSILSTLRLGSENYEQYVAILHDNVDAGVFSLDEIGTSEHELKKLALKGTAYAAAVDLELMEKFPGYRDFFEECFIKEKCRGRLAMSDIYRAQAELEHRQRAIPGTGLR